MIKNMRDTYGALTRIVDQSEYLQGISKEQKPCLMIYGSVVNSLCLESNADLDLTLLIDDFEINHLEVLRKLM